MQPEVQRLLEIAQNVDNALNTVSNNDATFRAMLHELKHQESVEQFCREQMAGVAELVTGMSGQFETQARELQAATERGQAANARVAELEAKLQEAASAVSGRDQIIGKPPTPLHAVDNAG